MWETIAFYISIVAVLMSVLVGVISYLIRRKSHGQLYVKEGAEQTWLGESSTVSEDVEKLVVHYSTRLKDEKK